MKGVKILLKCVIIISMFWGMTVGGPLSCGSSPGGAGCGCAGENGELPPAFQNLVDLVKAVIYAISPQIESGSKYIKQTFVGPRCGNIIDATQLQYAGIDFTEPINTTTFSIANNITVDGKDYFTNNPVTPLLSFDSYEFQNSDTRLVLWINQASIRADTNYTITFKSPVANPVKTAKGETITTKHFKPPAQGGGLDYEEDFVLPWKFSVRVPDGVLPYITNFGANGLDLTKVPPHSENLPRATFSERMSQVAVMYEMLTPGGWVVCPCDPKNNPLCNECPGRGVLGLNRLYRTTYLSSGTYCSYATRDLSGEPLTPWPGSNLPGNDMRQYTTSKVRIEEPVARPGEVYEYNINPVNIRAKATSDISSLSGYTDPSTQSFNYSLISTNYSLISTLPNGEKLFQYPFYSRFATTYRVFADAGNGGKDFVEVGLKPQPRIARIQFPKSALIFICRCQDLESEACKNGESPYDQCPFLSGISIPGSTTLWIPKAYYNDFAAIIFGVGIATGNPIFMIGSGILALLNYLLDFKLEIARVEINDSHLILEDMNITPTATGIHFYLNYRLWVNSGEVIYLGGLYRYSLGGRTLFGGLRINYDLNFGFNEYRYSSVLNAYIGKGLYVNLADFNVSMDWFDLPGASSSQNNRARDEIVNRIRGSFLEDVDENGMTGAQKLGWAFKYLVLTSLRTEIYYWDNNNNITALSSPSRVCTDECYNRCVNDCVNNGKAPDCASYCNPLLKPSYGLIDLYSDNPDYNWRIQVGENMELWEKWFSSGILRGRRCDEYTNSAPGLGNSPLTYIPQQAHYPHPDMIPFVFGNDSNRPWKWPSFDDITRNIITIQESSGNIYIELNYFDCVPYY